MVSTIELLEKRARDLIFFPFVESWFKQINAYAARLGIELKHYIISSGLCEMIKASKIGMRRSTLCFLINFFPSDTCLRQIHITHAYCRLYQKTMYLSLAIMLMNHEKHRARWQLTINSFICCAAHCLKRVAI